VVSPWTPSVGSGRESENGRSSNDAWGDKDVVQQRQLCGACEEFAAGEKPFLQRGARASDEERVVQVHVVTPLSELAHGVEE
jgi:hypothetical protein